MPRSLRYVPDGGSLVEITTRTFQSRLLLTPNPLLNRIILGALARASNVHQVGVVYEAYAFFVSAFRLAADKLKAGDQTASFPTGSFPPHLPFVRALTAESLASG